MAEVRLNGKSLGVLWHRPFRLEVGKALRTGSNTLEIDVTNLWVNRLIGDEQQPADCEWTGKHLTRWPDWFTSGNPMPSAPKAGTPTSTTASKSTSPPSPEPAC